MDRRPLGPFVVSPIGFGAMRLTGPNVFGPPKDRGEALIVLREAVHQGVDHIDTAQYYGPNVVNELIREALHPYPAELILVSKVGARRDREGGVLTDDEPRQLRQAIEENLRTLGVDALPVVNLRLMRDTGPDAFSTPCGSRRWPAYKTPTTSRTGCPSPCSRSAPGGGSRSCRSHRWASVSRTRTQSSAGPR
jgi:aryl-alcohol dehydrogenase-like predicted oxidoreductase